VGLLIAIEGGDGSGKGTQADELEKRATQTGYNVLKLSFPQYGKADDVHPELASLPFAIDRLGAKQAIIEHLQLPSAIVIADRYVASNLAHQGTKLSNKQERHQFYQDLLDIEYGLFALPKPDLNIVLLVPSELAQRNVDQKEKRIYTDKKRDIHEADANHLEKAKANYQELCRLFPSEFTSVKCLDSDAMRPIKDIHHDIWTYLEPLIKGKL